jgi:hypothetical protein
MNLDDDKIDEAVLALLLLGRHDIARAWKGFDWDAMNRLHEKGFISDPRGKAKSVVFKDAHRAAEAISLHGRSSGICAPVMRRTASFHHDSGWGLRGQERTQLGSRQPMVSRNMGRTIGDSNFENGLCEIDSDGRILHGGFLLFLVWSTEAR